MIRLTRAHTEQAARLTTLKAAGSLIRQHENCSEYELPLAPPWRTWQDDGLMRSDASERSGRSRLTQSVGSPLTAHRSPLTAHRSPLTAHRSPLTAHRSPSRSAAHRHASAARSGHASAARSGPVLTAAPSIRVAHPRHASVRPTADHLGRRPPLPPVHTSIRSDVADSNGQQPQLERHRQPAQKRHICARPRRCKMLLKEPHASAA